MYSGDEHAERYSKYRPYYPPSLIDYCNQLMRRNFNSQEIGNDVAVDVGCGSGQLTSVLADYYDKVIGTDESEAQIYEAKKQNRSENVNYYVSRSEKMDDIGDESVDLVSAAQSVHWFDEEKFYREVNRILKPDGYLLLVFYENTPRLLSPFEKGHRMSLPEIEHRRPDSAKKYAKENSSLTRVLLKHENFFYENGYLQQGAIKMIHKLDKLIERIPFVNRVHDQSFIMEKSMTVDDVIGYQMSKSYVNAYLKKCEDSEMMDRLKMDLIGLVDGRSDVIFNAEFYMDIVLIKKS